jgi:hypothetical protein
MTGVVDLCVRSPQNDYKANNTRVAAQSVVFGEFLMHRALLLLAALLLTATSRAEFLFERAGGAAVYDWHQDITWLQDANYAATSGYDLDGRLRYADTLIYIDYLNASQFLGVTSWRMPVMNYVTNNGEGTFGYCGTDKGHNVDPASGELAFLYYEHLKLQSKFDCNGQPQTPHGVTYSGPFININNIETQAYSYSTDYSPDPARAWAFHFEYGGQHADGKLSASPVWPVFSGDLLYQPGDALPADISMDVLPWNAANEIDPASEASLPVTMMGTAVFDAGQIDLGTVRFGAGKAMTTGNYLISDYNGDTYPDLAVFFPQQDTGIACGDNEVSVYGESYTGETFTATDSITTVECDTNGCHP